MSVLELLDAVAAPPARRPVSVGPLANVPDCEWAFDVAAIERAARWLGITRPIVLTTTRGLTAAGRQLDQRDWRGDYHEVRVSAIGYSALGASEVIWHELAHCAQSERYATPAEFGEAYNSHGRKGRAYWNNPFEVEAREHQVYAADMPLAVRS